MKVYVVGNDGGVVDLFKRLKHDVLVISNPLETAELLPNPNLVVFTGGADVWPVLYGEKNTYSRCDVRRDLEELIWFHRFYKVPKLGICRGGQFLNVCNGGSMIQDAPHHAIGGLHKYYDAALGRVFDVTSTHHQIMVASNAAQLAAYSFDMPDGIQTTEALYYKASNSFCFQPHPEYTYGGDENTTLEALRVGMKVYAKVVI